MCWGEPSTCVRYVGSKNCGIEMRLAAESGTPVIPVNLELSHQDWVGGSLAAIGPPGDKVRDVPPRMVPQAAHNGSCEPLGISQEPLGFRRAPQKC